MDSLGLGSDIVLSPGHLVRCPHGFTYSIPINLLEFIHALNVEHICAFQYALLLSHGTLRNDADTVISIRLALME
jgi:hypothetical protein